VALARIGDYIGQDLRFDDFEAGAAFVREVSASFGPHSDAEWDKLARDVLVRGDGGAWTRHYDRAWPGPSRRSRPSARWQDQAALWAAFDAIRCPTLLVRGAVRPAVARDGGGNDAARTAPRAGGNRRRGPCADLRAARADRDRAQFLTG
jgi:hypothetical protein